MRVHRPQQHKRYNISRIVIYMLMQRQLNAELVSVRQKPLWLVRSL